MNLSKAAKIAVALGAILLLAACATQPPKGLDSNPGFFSGLFHGFFFAFSSDRRYFHRHQGVQLSEYRMVV